MLYYIGRLGSNGNIACRSTIKQSDLTKLGTVFSGFYFQNCYLQLINNTTK